MRLRYMRGDLQPPGAIWMDFLCRALLSSLGVVESLRDLVLRAQHGQLNHPCCVTGTAFGFVPVAVAACDGSGMRQWAGQGRGHLNLHWAEQQGGAASSWSLPGTPFSFHG